MWKHNKFKRYMDGWGWYKFYPHHDELIHPDDLTVFRDVQTRAARTHGYLCTVVMCVGLDGDFLRLRWKHDEIRTRSDNYFIVPAPSLTWGDLVRIKRKPDRVRRVLEIWFQHTHKQIVYHIESTDPKGTSYWFADELEVVTHD